jgi:hypothetical protein
MKKLILFGVMLASLQLFAADAKENTVNARPWFQSEDCQSLTIQKMKSISDHKVVASAKIEDPKVLQNLIRMIKLVPADGDMMVSFGPDAAETELNFTCSGKQETLYVYGRGFKTPSTGFNSDKKEEEKVLVAGIEGLLVPGVSKITLKSPGQALQMGDFTVTYLGEKTATGAPTVSVTTDSYVIESKGYKETLDVTSGQTSPQPKKFKTGNKEYTLLTYESDKKERLFPLFFQIVPANQRTEFFNPPKRKNRFRFFTSCLFTESSAFICALRLAIFSGGSSRSADFSTIMMGVSQVS